MRTIFKAAIPVCVLFIAGAATAGGDWEFVRQLSKEADAQRVERHEKIAHRRAGPVVMVHRGASAVAPENTIEAYAAAMDLGADGCEVDLRITRDGVIVLFHDDMLDHLTESLGDIGELTFHETQKLRHRLQYGRKLPSTAPPTFVALLELARQRAMLLHLDVKMPGIDEAIAELLDEADAWDHIVAVNSETAPKLARNPKLQPLKYLGGLYENRRDMDPEAVAAMLPVRGEMIIVDDPRVCAAALHRTASQTVSLPKGLCLPMGAENGLPAPAYDGTNFNLFGYTRTLGRLGAGEAFVILSRDFPDAARPHPNPEEERQRTELIVQRAWAAQNVMPNWSSPRMAVALRNVVRTRSLHSNWRLHGLDGAAAVRALARLKDISAVPLLTSVLQSVDPELVRVSNMSQYGDYPVAWHDAVFKMYIMPALGDLKCPQSKGFLAEYIARPEGELRAWAPVQREEATKSLCRQQLSSSELADLVASTNSSVRGTVIVQLLNDPMNRYLLKRTAPWAATMDGKQ